MSKPKAIQLWAEDPLDNKCLGAIQFEYQTKDAGTGFYKKQINLIRSFAYLTAKHLCIQGIGIRKPKIRMRFVYSGKTKGYNFYIPFE